MLHSHDPVSRSEPQPAQSAQHSLRGSRHPLALSSVALLTMLALAGCGSDTNGGPDAAGAAGAPERGSASSNVVVTGAPGSVERAVSIEPLMDELHSRPIPLSDPLARQANPDGAPLDGPLLQSTPAPLPGGLPPANPTAEFTRADAPRAQTRSFVADGNTVLRQTKALPTGGVSEDQITLFETGQVHPLELTPNGTTLLVTNTAAGTLEIYDVGGPEPALRGVVNVGVDPISVRALNDRTAWVVNAISDSVSIVDVVRGTVVRTLQTDDEPADVVFAGNPLRAWVSSAGKRNLMVFDAVNPDTPVARIPILGQQPRALATSADKSKIYLAIFESGNGTTLLSGKDNWTEARIVNNPAGPYKGVNPPPNDGTAFKPPMNPANPPPPRTNGLIVKRDDQGRWFDDNKHEWTRFVTGGPEVVGTNGVNRMKGWDLIDRDLAIIDVATQSVTYQGGAHNIVMNLAVNPVDGSVTTIGTDALNHIRFEPNLNGKFLKVQSARFTASRREGVVDINPHLTYATASIPAADRAQSIGDPRGIAWNAAGTRAWVTGKGSNNVILLQADGTRAPTPPLAVGQGPTGVVLQENRGRGFVLNSFDGTISMISMAGNRVLSTTPLAWDPTPNVVRAGRPTLFDTVAGSGTGHLACNSCHVDSRTDRLAWDLGDPSGAVFSTTDSNGRVVPQHPVKGPALTMTMVDMVQASLLHWRGDKPTLNHFAATFPNLQGADTALSAGQFSAMTAYLRILRTPPNPYRNIDNTFSTRVEIEGPTGPTGYGNAVLGAQEFENSCRACHPGNTARGGVMHTSVFSGDGVMLAPRWQNFYRRLGLWFADPTASTTGFGFQPDGSFDATHNKTRTANLMGFMYSFNGKFPYAPAGLNATNESVTVPAAVGKQVTIEGKTPRPPLLNDLRALGMKGQIDLVVHGCIQGERRAARQLTDGSWLADRGERFTATAVEDFASPAHPLTFTAVRAGTGARIANDQDGDGAQDGNKGRSAARQCGNLLTNGSFETNGLAFGAVGSASGLASWTATPGVQVWRSPNGLQGIDGDAWVRLNTDAGTDTLSQTLATPAGTPMTVRFLYAAEAGTNAASNRFEVLWNGQVVSTVTPDGLAGLKILQHQVRVTASATGQDTLTFREAGTQQGNGAYIEQATVIPD